MSPLQKARLLLESFFERFDDRCAFQLLDGTRLEGYCLELEGDRVRFGSGGPLADGKDRMIPLDQLRLDSFAALDPQQRCYREARWDPATDSWVWAEC